MRSKLISNLKIEKQKYFIEYILFNGINNNYLFFLKLYINLIICLSKFNYTDAVIAKLKLKSKYELNDRYDGETFRWSPKMHFFDN